MIIEPRTDLPVATNLTEWLGVLERYTRELRTHIAALREEDLLQPCARGMNVGEFVRMIVRHVSWHAGQIAVVRRLYRDCKQHMTLT